MFKDKIRILQKHVNNAALGSIFFSNRTIIFTVTPRNTVTRYTNLVPSAIK